jgi:hypothetical protein
MSKNQKISSISIEPCNSQKIALNVANKVFKNVSSIDPLIYKHVMFAAVETIKEMEKNNLTTYKGPIDQA